MTRLQAAVAAASILVPVLLLCSCRCVQSEPMRGSHMPQPAGGIDNAANSQQQQQRQQQQQQQRQQQQRQTRHPMPYAQAVGAAGEPASDPAAEQQQQALRGTWVPEGSAPAGQRHPVAALRGDLAPDAPFLEEAPQLFLGECTKAVKVLVPRFETVATARPAGTSAGNSSSSSSSSSSRAGQIGSGVSAQHPAAAATTTSATSTSTRMVIEELQLPAQLDSSVIAAVKAKALAQLLGTDTTPAPSPQAAAGADSAAARAGERGVRAGAVREALRRVNKRMHSSSGFVHPAGTVGPSELALLQARLQSKDPAGALQRAAVDVMLSGRDVPLKRYPPTNWAPPNDTPRRFGAGDTNYTGPYPMEVVQAQWYGASGNGTTCPRHYPPAAPYDICGHISLVENDAQMAYRQAVAYWVTGNATHARNAFNITDSWARANREMGLLYQNGPLEAGWAVAAMARALELLRDVPGWQDHYDAFVGWTRSVTMPVMDFYAINITSATHDMVPHLHGNWHSTVAEAWAAVALLTDDRPRFDQAVQLYRDTVASYLKWGRGHWAVHGGVARAPGECSETLRDIFHSEFGLGGLLQVAEMAWQQGIDAYAASDHALLAALELHARIINAGTDASLLPPGFAFVESLPPPPNGTFWKFDIRSQAWWAHDAGAPEVRSQRLDDGVKYLVGVMWLPTGWELGYNHYAGRLGVPMPETAKLLARHPVEFFTFHWGLGTLTHADTAMPLWRAGLARHTVCGGTPAPRASPPE